MDSFTVTEVAVAGYRGFSRFHASGFAQVNLIVGRNNSGKSTLLEALEIGLAHGHPGRLSLQSLRRQEWYTPASEVEQAVALVHEEKFFDVRQLFHGRQLLENSEVKVETFLGPVRTGCALGISRDEAGRPVIRGMNLALLDWSWQLGLVENAGVSLGDLVEKTRALEPEPTAVRSIDSTRISAASLARMWTEAVQPRRAEADIASAMAMVDDRIEDIICVDTRGERGWSSFLVGLRGQATRVPLGSLGEGAGRLLGLAVTSVAARGGTLLVDEIDTGLHHSVFDAFWPWLIDRATSAATRFQLFATTHSEDCVRGLARAVAESKQRADSVSLHRMVPDEDTTRRFSGQLLVSAVESFLEVR